MSETGEEASAVQRERRWAWTAPLFAAALLLAFAPVYDQALERLFWRPGSGFFLGDLAMVQVLYSGTRWVMRVVIAALLGTLLCAYLAGFPRLRAARAKLWFAAAALAIGPGLLAHTLLKDHWGRPRPVQVIEFGGEHRYVPPWQAGGGCARNCSFVSGHAAAGFYLITGAWLWPRHRRAWLGAGLAAGSLVGLARMLQGGHWASDVVGAFALVWLTNAALHAWVQTRRRRLLPAP